MIGMIYAGTVCYFYRNLMGDIREIYTDSGNSLVKYGYDAYGNCSTLSGTSNYTISSANSIRYRGYYYDTETRFYCLGARYYDPQARRFISPDDTAYIDPESVNGLNLYVYADNNPISFIYNSFNSAVMFNSGMNMLVGNMAKADGSLKNSLPPVSWLAANSTSIYGAFSAIKEGAPILTHYYKYASFINDEFNLYGISKLKTSIQLSNVNLSIQLIDASLIGINVLIDMYDSYQRGVGAEGIIVGGTLTALSGVGMLYLNKGIMWGATTIGTAICPGLGTAIGFTVGLIVSISVDYFLGGWIADWIDENIK